MTESFYRELLLDGKARKLQDLVALASAERKPAEAKRFAADAQRILRDINDIDFKLMTEGPSGLDYSETLHMNEAIVKFLEATQRPADEDEITQELIRGRFSGYRDGRTMSIRVGRCIRSYTVGKAKENPRLKVRKGLVGLPDWPDSVF